MARINFNTDEVYYLIKGVDRLIWENERDIEINNVVNEDHSWCKVPIMDNNMYKIKQIKLEILRNKLSYSDSDYTEEEIEFIRDGLTKLECNSGTFYDVAVLFSIIRKLKGKNFYEL